MRLKAAEDNLNRLEDVMKQLDSQVDSLRRQARQAGRYKNLASDIRKNEALVLHISHRDIVRSLAEAERTLQEDERAVEDRTKDQAEAARLQAIAAYELPPLRDAEAKAGAGLQRLVLAREQLEGEEQRAKQREAELERRLAQLDRDLAREKAMIADAAGVLAKLDAERDDLDAAAEASEESDWAAKERLADAEGRLAECEQALATAQTALADLNARRGALESALAAEEQRLRRFEGELANVTRELDELRALAGSDDDFIAAAERLEGAQAQLDMAEEAALSAEEAHAQARERESSTRAPHTEAERKAQRLETEVRTLSKLLATAESDLWPPVVEEIAVEKGYEAALGAALGDDLDASTNTSAPAHWSLAGPHESDPSLPPGVVALADMVKAPPAARAAAGADRRRRARRRRELPEDAEARPAARLQGRRPVALGRLHRRRRSADARGAAPR